MPFLTRATRNTTCCNSSCRNLSQSGKFTGPPGRSRGSGGQVKIHLPPPRWGGEAVGRCSAVRVCFLAHLKGSPPRPTPVAEGRRKEPGGSPPCARPRVPASGRVRGLTHPKGEPPAPSTSSRGECDSQRTERLPERERAAPKTETGSGAGGTAGQLPSAVVAGPGGEGGLGKGKGGHHAQ